MNKKLCMYPWWAVTIRIQDTTYNYPNSITVDIPNDLVQKYNDNLKEFNIIQSQLYEYYVKNNM